MQRVLILVLTCLASPALAHHPLAGAPLTSFRDGILSGIGHPILGFDHLFFVLAIGLAARFSGRGLTGPMVYVAAMLAGCWALYAGVTIPAHEAMIVASLVVVGGFIASGRAMGRWGVIVLFGGFGLFHGAGLGTTIAGQEGAIGGDVLTGYLIGLAVVQYLIAVLFGTVGAWVIGAKGAGSIPSRLMGSAICGAGVFMALEMAEGPIVTMLTRI